MITKVAGFLLAGSLATLTIGGLAGAGDSGDHEFRGHGVRRHHVRTEVRERVRREVRQHRRDRREFSGADATGADASPLGTYKFDVAGNVLNKFAWAAQVELDLQDEGRYELRVKTDIDGDTETATTWGRFRLRGDQVRLYSAHDDDTFDLTLKGDRLELNTGLKEMLALKAVGIDDAAFVKASGTPVERH